MNNECQSKSPGLSSLSANLSLSPLHNHTLWAQTLTVPLIHYLGKAALILYINASPSDWYKTIQYLANFNPPKKTNKEKNKPHQG